MGFSIQNLRKEMPLVLYALFALRRFQNSPGHRPRACQNLSTSVQSLFTVPFGYWTPVLESRGHHLWCPWGGGRSEEPSPSTCVPPFGKGSKNYPEIGVLLDRFWEPTWLQLGSQNLPKSVQNRCQDTFLC